MRATATQDEAGNVIVVSVISELLVATNIND